MKVEGVDDEKSGAVTLDSVLLIDFDTREDTWGKVAINLSSSVIPVVKLTSNITIDKQKLHE